MCFSAGASFTGGVIISAIGVAVVTKVHKPSQLLFASIPLFFGLQQFTEGILWLTISNSKYLIYQQFATYFFLFMADFLWPVLVPLSILLMEKNARKRKMLWVLLITGIIVSLYYGSCLLLFHITPVIKGYHIKYLTDFPDFMEYPAVILYLVATLPPLFISSVKRVYILGILMFFSCLVTALFFTQFLLSVWCFFAAFISGVIFWILNDSKKTFRFEELKILKDALAQRNVSS
jgi:hypothetical protein